MDVAQDSIHVFTNVKPHTHTHTHTHTHCCHGWFHIKGP